MSNIQGATLTPTEYKEYIFQEGTSEGERLALQHLMLKSHFQGLLRQIFDDYGLAERVQAATPEQPVRILDVGCGEGLYLHDVAEELANRHLFDPAKVKLIGIDLNAQAIATAYDFARMGQPPRPYLEFFTHDLNTPLASNPGILNAAPGLDHAPQFDFIYSMMVLEHLNTADQHLARLYDTLKPGGVIYLRDLDTNSYDPRYETMAMGRFTKIFNSLLASHNPGNIVAYKNADWLKELGATEVRSNPHVIRSGGTSREGMLLLKNFVYITRSASPMLVRLGLITQAEQTELLQALFKEITPQSEADVTFVDTLARKPGL